MKRRALKWVLAAAAFGACVLAGCQGGPGPGHIEAVGNATKRWQEKRSSLMLQMAQRQFDSGDLDMAEKTVNEALSIDPVNARLYVLLGRVKLERGQLERAHLLLSRAIELDAKLHEPRYYKGVVLQRWQQYEPALTCYQEAYALVPDSASYLLAVAEMLVALERQDDALKLLTGKLTYFDQNAGIRLAIAQLHAMARRWDQAIEFYTQGALLRPDDPQVLEDLAAAQLAGGKTEAAVSALNRLLAAPTGAERRDLQRMLGRAYVVVGRHADAKAVFVKLTRSDPTDVEAWTSLGETCWALEDTAGSQLAANRVRALAPSRHEGYLLSGLVSQKHGQVDDALKSFDRAAELAPASTAPLILRGMLLEQAGRRQDAAAAYAAALQRQPDDSRAQALWARLNQQP